MARNPEDFVKKTLVKIAHTCTPMYGPYMVGYIPIYIHIYTRLYTDIRTDLQVRMRETCRHVCMFTYSYTRNMLEYVWPSQTL